MSLVINPGFFRLLGSTPLAFEDGAGPAKSLTLNPGLSNLLGIPVNCLRMAKALADGTHRLGRVVSQPSELGLTPDILRCITRWLITNPHPHIPTPAMCDSHLRCYIARLVWSHVHPCPFLFRVR